MPMNVPKELPMLEKRKTNRMWVILFRKNPRKVRRSSGRFSKSVTRGLRSVASTIPVSKPTPMVGFSEVIGAPMKAAAMVIGCAKAKSDPIADSVPLTNIHFHIIERLSCQPERKNPATINPMMIAGTRYGRIREIFLRGGIVSREEVSFSRVPACSPFKHSTIPST